MATAIDDLLRLAWQADWDGKPGLRDALMTLAVVDGGAENAVVAERCRRLLVARRPDHWFATIPTLGQAIAHPKVAAALSRLRATFPPIRVKRHLLRAAVLRGPFQGQWVSMPRVLEDLALSDGRRKPAAVPALPFPSSARDDTGETDPDGSLTLLYATVLLAMAVLLRNVIEPASRDSRAA